MSPAREITLTVEPHNAPDRFISITRARCVARYKMKSIPGRPEELERIVGPIAEMPHSTEPIGIQAVLPRVISFAYSGGELRIRKHGGADNREWIDTRDIRLTDGWLDKVYEFLDGWMGYISPANIRAPRPIRDNPQA